MKKLLALTVVLCLVLCLVAGCSNNTVEPYEEEEETTEPVETEPAETEAEPAETEELVSIGQGGTGYETYPADTVVATVNGSEITWMEYFYWLRYYTQYVVQFAAQYGLVLTSWTDYDLSGTNTNAEVVLMNAQANVIQDHVILTKAAEFGIEPSEEDEAMLLDIVLQNADSVTGDGDGEATEEEIALFETYLQEMLNVDRAFFDQFNTISLLSQLGFEYQFGAAGEKLSDEDTLAYAEDSGLLGAKHILLLTVDADTREALDDETIAEKRALAEDLLAQLQAVQDDPAALAALFDQLTAEYTEDTGYAYYPEGYVFGEGEMVQAFEDAVKSLEIGGLSDIVESEYGYHIILRTSIDPDAIIGTDSNGNEVSLRYAAATQLYSSEIQDWVDTAEVVWNEGFETPDLAAIFG